MDTVTADSIYGYEPDSSQLLPGEHTFTTERVILPDTSQFLESPNHLLQSSGPLVSFPKYNNYLLDKSKFDKNSKVVVPLKLLGIAPEHGDLITKHTLPDSRAVLSYAEYKQAGQLLPHAFDDSVVRRWGVDITIGSPLISVSILVPEYIEAVPKKEIKVHFQDDVVHESPFDRKVLKKIPEDRINENNAEYYKIDSLRVKRDKSNRKLMYKNLGAAPLPIPIRMQIVLDSNMTIFNERSNPQCVGWSHSKR